MESPKESEERSKPDFENISNSEIENLIDEWIHSERDRQEVLTLSTNFFIR